MNNIIDKVDEIINIIKESNDYKNYQILKEKVSNDKDIMFLINDIKTNQKRIVNLKYNNKDYSKEEEIINKDLSKLNDYPIYVEFNNLQSELNDQFQYIKNFIEKELNKKIEN